MPNNEITYLVIEGDPTQIRHLARRDDATRAVCYATNRGTAREVPAPTALGTRVCDFCARHWYASGPDAA